MPQLRLNALIATESESESRSVVSDSLQPRGLCSPWNSPDQNTRVGSLSLLQGIFPTQGSNPGLLHGGQILYQLSRQGSPRTLQRVASPFCSWSSKPRNCTGVSCIVGGFFTSWATREARRYWGPAQFIGLPRWFNGKESACQGRRHRFDPRVSKIPWRRKRQPPPVFLPEKSHGQRSVAGCSSWGLKELDTTERTWTQWYPFFLSLYFFYY